MATPVRGKGWAPAGPPTLPSPEASPTGPRGGEGRQQTPALPPPGTPPCRGPLTGSSEAPGGPGEVGKWLRWEPPPLCMARPSREENGGSGGGAPLPRHLT